MVIVSQSEQTREQRCKKTSGLFHWLLFFHLTLELCDALFQPTGLIVPASVAGVGLLQLAFQSGQLSFVTFLQA